MNHDPEQNPLPKPDPSVSKSTPIGKTRSAPHPLQRWTRSGILDYPWSPFETFEQLLLTPSIRDKLVQWVDLFLRSEEEFHRNLLPWRLGLFFYGPAGSGKTAASKALAKALEWSHFTIPSHEILNAHLLEKALASAITHENPEKSDLRTEAPSQPEDRDIQGREWSGKSTQHHPAVSLRPIERVIVLEDIDTMIRTLEPKVFFSLLDHAFQRAEGTFWIGTTRHPEHSPKTQIIRPGRLEEAIRFEFPSGELRKHLLQRILVPPPSEKSETGPDQPRTKVPSAGSLDWDLEPDPQSGRDPLHPEGRGLPFLDEWIEKTAHLSFAHFEELRQLSTRLKVETTNPTHLHFHLEAYINDQLIAGDRLGAISDTTDQLENRIRGLDPRLLLAAVDMTDIHRRLIEHSIADAVQNAQNPSESPQ